MMILLFHETQKCVTRSKHEYCLAKFNYIRCQREQDSDNEMLPLKQ